MEMSQGTKMRLFFALWPSAAECAALAAWHTPLRELCGGRVMRTDTLHSTLVFLGEVEESRLEVVLLLAKGLGSGDFELKLTAAHYWGHNHIVYAAPEEPPPQLAKLVLDLEAKLRKHRFNIEKRPYKAHVTLLRNAQWSDAALPPLPAVSWRFNDFVLVRSLRDEDGSPQYDVLARFPLQGAS